MSSSNSSIVNDQEAFQCLLEISNLLNTGLDETTLRYCVRLCEEGSNPQALAQIVQELKRQVSTSSVTLNNSNNSTSS